MGSPPAGLLAAFLCGSNECTQISPDGPGPLNTGTEVCAYNWNEEAGLIIALAGFVISGIWLAITILAEQRG